MFESVSWNGVGAATLAAFVLGSLWFGPLFSKRWMAELGRTVVKREGPPSALGPLLGAQLVATAITATVLAVVIERFGTGVTTGLTVGLLCAAGFVATAKLADVLFAQASTPGRFWIEAGNQLASYALMGAIYGAFA